MAGLQNEEHLGPTPMGHSTRIAAVNLQGQTPPYSVDHDQDQDHLQDPAAAHQVYTYKASISIDFYYSNVRSEFNHLLWNHSDNFRKPDGENF